jgi:carbonic anhydrase/acetyltransferase-like protein (isoleucine patch superfamily)
VLSTIPPINLRHPFVHPIGFSAARPNTPVAPYGASHTLASFIDPSVGIVHGEHVIVGYKDFIGPYAKIDASTGIIKIGDGSSILDNATIVSNPTGAANPTTSVLIGSAVLIGFGATVTGPSSIGAFGDDAAPAEVGNNATINGATIEQGAIVGALAYVGPGVTIPTGVRVLPGASITTQADLSDPTKVTAVTTADFNRLSGLLKNNQALAGGYIQLYQGNSATGASPGVTISGVFNGNLAAVRGVSSEPGSANGPAFEPSSAVSPAFIGPRGGLIATQLPNYFTTRITGQVVALVRAFPFGHRLGLQNAIRADQGQPIFFTGYIFTGNSVTINAPLTTTTANKGNALAFGQNVHIGTHAVVLGSAAGNTIGTNVTIGSGAVVDSSNVGDGAIIGNRAYVSGSTVAPGTTIPDGEILINNKVVGFVQS